MKSISSRQKQPEQPSEAPDEQKDIKHMEKMFKKVEKALSYDGKSLDCVTGLLWTCLMITFSIVGDLVKFN